MAWDLAAERIEEEAPRSRAGGLAGTGLEVGPLPLASGEDDFRAGPYE
jgi:hypothetical protein